MSTGLQRRTFVKGGAAVALGIGAATMAGGVTGALADEAAEVKSVWDLGEIGEPIETIETPVLIIGGGGAGMAAAIQCVELGVTPTIVEAQGFLSGAFIGTEFIDGVGSPEQLAYEADDSVDLALYEHMHYHHYIPPRDLCARFIGMIPENVEWLKEQGVEFSIAAGYKSRALMYKFEEGHLAGEQFVATFVKRVEELGVDIMTDTRARKLVQADDGTVTGAVVETKDGSFVQVNAGAVILATGGYGNNPEFLDEVSPHEAEVIDVIGMPYRRADGIKMAVAAGARTTEGLSATMWLGPSIIGAVPPEWQQDSYSVGVQPALWFNQDCKRFINEDIFEANFSGAGNGVRNQTKSYMLFTEEQMVDWGTNGSWVMCFSFGAPASP